ncbi:origin recognition complex subunit 5 [Chrysoperla carnea]|uniref:origin recognition complex subunit 5 n=1 Tax=Chrysoperla carnea TaxID=189513 RepID=UPI001D0928A4|nr:origin recognition complex subunit 5 [Chrysoperla carnea]
MDNDILERLNKLFPCREKQLLTLNHLIGNVDEILPECIFIYGNTSTGKTTIIKRFLSENNTNHVIVNLIECFSNKLIFESILNKFTNHSLASNAYKPFVKCDNVYDFTTELIKANEDDGDLTPFIIVLDKVERLRSNELLLSVFLRLQEITKLNICIIMLSDIIFEHFFPTSLKSPIKVYFPHYTKDELLTILTLNFEHEKRYIENEFNQPFDVNINFYKNYINIVLSVFYRACRDISEIKYVVHLNLKHYCEPVINKKLDENDVSSLWQSDFSLKESKNDDELNRNIAITLELPFYAKYLLIAAYLASYNPIKEDKRLFMKYHGKKRNNKKRIDSKQNIAEKTNLMLGPKMFTLDRLLAIFYAIIDEQVPLTSNLLVQLSSLVELKLLNLVGNDIDLTNHKYRCLVAYEFIETISKMVGFNIRKYLFDMK